jgi:hypothetical protein
LPGKDLFPGCYTSRIHNLGNFNQDDSLLPHPATDRVLRRLVVAHQFKQARWVRVTQEVFAMLREKEFFLRGAVEHLQ